MPFNLHGTSAAFHALFRPRLILPNMIVHDIRFLDFTALKKAGYRGAILDKDNCLTLPHRDVLLPELDTAWKEFKREFGTQNILIVSNSAGTLFDAGGLAAESVSHNLQVPVLRHSSMKPSRRTMASIKRYFSSIPSPISDPSHLIVIGDRVLTDVVLGNMLGAYSILVSRDWTQTFMSWVVGAVERYAVELVRRWLPRPSTPAENAFFKEVQAQKDVVKLSYSGSSWTWTGRALGIGPNTGKRR